MPAADFAAPEPKREPAAPIFRDSLVTVYQADCLDLLPAMPADSVAVVITDPPYGLEFMGQEWDAPWLHSFAASGYHDGAARLSRPSYASSHDSSVAYQAWCARWAGECLRVLKPGGHLLAFGSTRTWHRLATALEDAGFEIRDTIAWLYGQGFPKSSDVSKAIDRTQRAHRTVVSHGRPVKRMIPAADQSRTGAWRKDSGHLFIPTVTTPATGAARRWQGWGTGLKPAFEPIIVARKPLAGTVAANVLEHGTGGLNIDACRVPISDTDRVTIDRKHAGMSVDTYRRLPGSSLNLSVKPLALKPAHAHELGRWPANVVLVHRPDSGDSCMPDCPVAELDRQSGISVSRASSPRHGAAGRGWGMTASGAEHNDTGGASRFFPAFRWQAKAPSRERPKAAGQGHPTVKPVALMRWLVRLVTPPGGLVLDPFLGSGTTAEAARAEGFRCIGIEREAAYVPLIRARLSTGRSVSVPVRDGEQSPDGNDALHNTGRDSAQVAGYRGPP